MQGQTKVGRCMWLHCIDRTLLCKQDLEVQLVFWSSPDLPHCVMKWDWGQGGWTGAIVCWGEGVIGVKRFGLLEGSLPLWMERKETRAGQSQPLGIQVELEWPTPRIRWLPKRAQWVYSQDLLCEGQAWWILQNSWCWILWPCSHTLPFCCIETFDAISVSVSEKEFYCLLWMLIHNTAHWFLASKTLEDTAAPPTGISSHTDTLSHYPQRHDVYSLVMTAPALASSPGVKALATTLFGDKFLVTAPSLTSHYIFTARSHA